MKRLFTLPEWKRYQRNRQRYQDERQKRAKRLRKRKRSVYAYREIAKRQKRRPKSTVQIEAPRIFSLVKNPEEMCEFFNRLWQENAQRRRVFLDLSGLTDLTLDAVTVLIARVSRSGRTGVQVAGSLPVDPAVRNLLVQTGFFGHVQATLPWSDEPRGKLYQRTSYAVDPRVAEDLIFRVSRGLLGRDCDAKGVYSTFIEIMGNTHEHADVEARPGEEAWWAAATFDPATRRGQFAFVDEGVGIFNSVRLRPVLKGLRALGIKSHAAVFRDMLEGRIPSRTGLRYRGNGMPTIYKRLKAGLLEGLVVVTNDVFADVGRGMFKTVSRGFRGTLLYWEAGEAQYATTQAVDSKRLQQNTGAAP